ncbi:MAG: heme lyase CcmF/NrfE family subunit [Gemmatimonadota bacterium]|nr:heme lyase CcmF/NrfE family subunit [Gemmatimonadota bacterium]
MIQLGELSLWIALPVALWGAVFGFAGGRLRRGDLVASAERSVYAVFGLIVLVSAGIIAAFVGNHYEFWYVASYSNRELDLFYKVSGLWAGQRGSLVFWVLWLTFFSSVTVFTNRRRNREFMPYVVGTLMTITSFFLIVLLFADVNPFERLGFTPANGRGLNPQLQNYWMTIHPPTLYLGFTAFTIPFAFGVAALLSGHLDARWIKVTRRWTLLSWFFLSNGIIFGMRWAYEELGWGGYWFWDPVENASLLPWLTATAFLHSIQIQENRGMLKIWNMSLVFLTFLLTIFATFLTRSGLIESVHSFAQELKIAYIFLSFMGALIIVGALLILYRRDRLRTDHQLQSFLSREAAFLFNNLILLGAAFAVLWGTLFPLITEGLTGQKANVGPEYFNRVNVPIGLVLLALTGIGPVIAWRRATARNLRRAFLTPLAVTVVLLTVLMGLGMRNGWALTTFAISGFVMTVIVLEFWKGTRARARIEGEGFLPALYHLVQRNRRRWGGYVVHASVVVIFTAFAASQFDSEVQATILPGEVVEVQSAFGHTYRLTYEGLSTSRDGSLGTSQPNVLRWVATFDVQKDGEPLGVMTAERRYYVVNEQAASEVGIRSTFAEDLYVILAGVEDLSNTMFQGATGDAERATVEVQVNPLVGWIWYGGMLLALGSLIALWPTAVVRVDTAAGASRERAVPSSVG